MTVTEQGNWLPFMSTTDVENYTGENPNLTKLSTKVSPDKTIN